MKAMILAAGKGTRLLPLTKDKPKVLIEIQGITLLEHTINYLKYYGIDEIIINVHHFANKIIKLLESKNYFNIRIEISDETDQLLETGGGLKKASWFFDDDKPFCLTGSDVLMNLDLNKMYEFHLQNNPLATLALKKRESSRDFIIDEKNFICGWRNNLTGEMKNIRTPIGKSSNIAFSVMHIINPSIFNFITEKGAFSMTNLYLRLTNQHSIMGYVDNTHEWFECGRIENYEKLNQSPIIAKIIQHYNS